ncbi:MAG: adenylate/guanylate cyclase domain-containing protein [Sphingobacteriales bacterium]|nr:MAG: adenylate/guanylate cyclase domain-containing protein [Sphingobacteriales bacterium]
MHGALMARGRFLFMLLVLLVLLVMQGCRKAAPAPRALNGIIDLQHWNFEKQGTITPDGYWEMYWMQLYVPPDFIKQLPPPALVSIPGNWNTISIGDSLLPGQGYATYRLRTIGMPQGLMAIRMPDAYSAYRLWINGVPVASNGRVGTTAAMEIAALRPLIRTFDSRQENEIVIQVSNYLQHKGGLGITPEIGTVDQIMQNWSASQAFTVFLAGMLLILALYHLLIFFTTRHDYNPLWFAFLCLFIAARSLSTAERILNNMFPAIPASIITRVEYASVFGGVTLFACFIQGLIPKDFPAAVSKVLMVAGLVQLALFCLTPVIFFSSILTVFQLWAVCQLVYLVVVIATATAKKRQGAKAMMVVIIITLIVGVNDILYARSVVDTTFALPLAVPGLLIIQAYFIAHRIGHSLHAVEKLSNELNSANQELENKVVDRTAALITEKGKTEELLLNILPAETAAELKEKGFAVPRTYSLVTVMFIKLTRIASDQTGADGVLSMTEIGDCFNELDHIIARHQLEKVKTIGDVYLCVSGLPVPILRHAEHTIAAAKDMLLMIQERKAGRQAQGLVAFDVKIGISSGPVVAGIVGSKKFAFDIWGDTVNTAARMQQHSEVGRINISGLMHKIMRNTDGLEYRGKLEAKNKGMIDMYYAR